MIINKRLLHYAQTCSQQEFEQLMASFKMSNVDEFWKLIKELDEAAHPKPATAQELKARLNNILKNPDAAFSSYDRIYENRFKSPEDLIQSYKQAIAEAEEREARAKAQAS